MSLKKKILVAVIGCVVVISIVVGTIIYTSIRQQSSIQIADAEKALLREKELSLKAITDSAIAMMESGFAGADEESVRAQVVEALSAMRFADGAGYFFAYEKVADGSYVFGFHGAKPEMNGTVAELDGLDPKGFAFRKALVDVAASGGGMVEYYYENPKTGEIMRKMSYARAYEPWNWVMVTGIYIDDIKESVNLMAERIDSKTREMLVRLGLIVGVVLAVCIAVLYWLIHTSINPLYSIIERLRAGAEEVGNASSEVSAVSQSLAEGATEQAAGIQETSSSLQEISSRIAAITEEMKTAGDFMKQVELSVESGASTSHEARQTMDMIKHASDENGENHEDHR